MIALSKGANAPLSSLALGLSFEVGAGVDLATLALAAGGRARSAADFVPAQGPVAVDLAQVASEVEAVRFVATLQDAGRRFGAVGVPVARVADPTGVALVEFPVSGLSSESSLIVLELYRRQGTWKVRAVGQGYDGGLPALLADHGLDATAVNMAPPAPTVPAPPAVPVFDPVVPAAPVVPARGDLWDRVEYATDRPVRPVAWALDDTAFTVCERVRDALPSADSLPPGVDKFQVAGEATSALRAVHGTGFEYAWRDDADRPLDPPWVTLLSALVDHGSGRIVACGHPTHEQWGLSPAYDLGAINGSNGLSWPGAGHTDGLVYPTETLYIGSTRTGALVPVDARANLVSVDYDAATGTIAVLEALGTAGCLAVYEHGSATKRRLGMVEPFSGNEEVRFSPDGRWLLVPRYDGSLLCELASGRVVRIVPANCCWWPGTDSTLLEVARVDGRCVPRLYSLEQDAYVHDFPEVRLDEEWLPGLEHVWGPAVSPDGAQLLVRAHAGVSLRHREEHGVGGHLVQISLADGRGRLVHPALVPGPQVWERDVAEVRWTGSFPRRSVTLHPALAGRLVAGDLAHPFLDPARYADEAEQLVVTALNAAIALLQRSDSMAHLMPEIVTALPALRADEAIWSRQREWLEGLAATTTRMIASGELAGADASAWQAFGSSLRTLAAGALDLVGLLDASYVREVEVAPASEPGGRYPSATPEQRELMEGILGTVLGNRGGGEFEPRQIAAMSLLCQRLVDEDPSLAAFVDDVREIARTEAASRPQSVSWRSLVDHL